MPGAQNDTITVTPKIQKPVAPATTPVPTKPATEPVQVFSTTSPFMNATIHLSSETRHLDPKMPEAQTTTTAPVQKPVAQPAVKTSTPATAAPLFTTSAQMPGPIDSAAAHDIYLQMKIAKEEKKTVAASLRAASSSESIKAPSVVESTSSKKSKLAAFFAKSSSKFF
ncbi:hypothetical protein HDU79_009797 [Rhizoclosmatium sp. JEL0117]|nr:hypothetical protein HDU79_009797 [Rhizoclosmatium sp. JEL0117]